MLKRSISPLIATILLIVVSVILVTVILTWGSDFAKENLNSVTTLDQLTKSDLSSFITLDSFSQTETGNNIIIRNLHTSRDLNLIGYKIVTDSNYVFSNQLLYFDEVITISPGELRSLNIICFPEKEFILQLVNTDLSYVTLPIKNNLYNSESYCLGRDDVVAAYDMTTIIGDKLIDVSENGHDGTIYGDVDYNEEGMFFELSGRVEIGDPPDLNFQPNDSFSIGALFSVADIQFWIDDTLGAIIGRGKYEGSVGMGANATWNQETQTMSWLRLVIGSRAINSISFSYTIQKNQKYHVFFVYTPGYQYTYINGVLVNTRDNSAGLSGSFSGNWGIFVPRAVPGGNGFNISGFCDNVLIYDKALTSEEINRLYLLSVSPLE